MPALPASYWLRYCRKIFQDHEPVELAAASATEADRGWPTPYESVEPKGKFVLSATIII